MKKSHPVIGGVIGAALGYVVTFIGLELADIRMSRDPIESGLLALLVLSPIGAVAGLVLGAKLAMRRHNPDESVGLAGSSFKALAVVIGLLGGTGAIYYYYTIETGTQWLNPNAASPALRFEIRLPASAALPADPEAIAIELQTDKNTMPGEVNSAKSGGDSGRPEIFGQVDLTYRAAYRHLSVKITGQPDRLYQLELTAAAPHSRQFGPWQTHADGSEIRYRAEWPGQQ